MSNYVPCPNCGSNNLEKLGYTWWGGFIGPKIFHYVRCKECNTKYNGKTGKQNIGLIVLYNIIFLAILIYLVRFL